MRSIRPRFAGLIFAVLGAAPLLAEEPTQQAPAAPTVEPMQPKVEAGAEEYWTALRKFESKKPEELKAGRAALERAASREFTHAQLLLGECYGGGSYGFPVDKSKAVSYFRLAAERGNAFAQVSYGLCLFTGFGVHKNEEKAEQWLNAAVAPQADYSTPKRPSSPGGEAGQPDAPDAGITGDIYIDPVENAKARAHFALGMIADGKKNAAAAQAHFIAAATAGGNGRAGIQNASMAAAVNYAFGHGVPRDPAKASEMLTLAKTQVKRTAVSLVHNYAAAKLIDDFAVADAEDSVAKASDELETNLEFGIATEFTDKKSKNYNPQEAIRWFELAAENGKEWAMLELAFLYTRGDAGAAMPEKAFHWFQKAGEGEHPKHYAGVANLIICYENGIGVARDPAKAREIAQRHQDSELVSYLTLKGQCPKTIQTYDQLTALNKEWAKSKDDPFAMYLFGVRYLNGWGVERSFDRAESWLKKAGKGGVGIAWRKLGEVYQAANVYYDPATTKKMNDAFRAGAKLKDAGCLAHLGYSAMSGIGMKHDEAMGEAYYREALALDPNVGMALNNLGALYESRFHEAQEKKQSAVADTYKRQMLEYYEKAARNGFTLATRNLAILYEDGSLGAVDHTKAYDYFQKAAEDGDTEARFRLGQMHEQGLGVPVTPEEAAYHYRLAALDGHVTARRRLVSFYLNGDAGAQDLDRAAFWLELCIRQGETLQLMPYVDIMLKREDYAGAVKLLKELEDAQDSVVASFAYDRLAWCYQHGRGVNVDLKRAARYRDKAVALGNGDAMVMLANQKLQEKKNAEAIELYEKAAENGSANAIFALGQMHLNGQYVPQDTTKAIAYLHRAADLNHPRALYFLAALTVNRTPGAPTLDEAIDLAKRSAALGDKDAPAIRDRLERRRAKAEAK